MCLMPTAKPKTSVYQLKITLTAIEPPIWRRIRVPSTIALCCLHDALQAVLGWNDSHLHRWEKDGLYWGVPEHYEEDGIEVIDESKVPVRRVLRAEGETMVYVYDLGDNWRHQVVLEKIRSALPVDVSVHQKMSAGRQVIRSSWR